MKKSKVKLMEDKSKLNIDNVQLKEVGEYKTLQHKKRAFLAAFAETGNISAASRLTGISRQAHYEWMESDPDYPAMFKAADQQAAEALETEARRRAVQGTLRPVFYQGNECGVVREYSDTLLIFLLKGAMPGKYKDNVSVDANVSITFEQLLKKALESGD
jgi:hypothetical protein